MVRGMGDCLIINTNTVTFTIYIRKFVMHKCFIDFCLFGKNSKIKLRFNFA